MKVVCVCGARPNFMKIAPLMDEMRSDRRINCVLVHTGQHYDNNMSRAFFDDLCIPRPDVNLEVGSSSHAVQTAEIMKRFEPLMLQSPPDWMVVVGDVNSTIACAMVAAKLCIKVAHVEAGLRSFDRTMPEEINRVLTDAISDLLFVTERSGVENLRNEGIAESKIKFVGNVMIDTLLKHRRKANESVVLERFDLTSKGYLVVTLHRPSNVDDRVVFSAILKALAQISRDVPVVFPMHPRTRSRLSGLGLSGLVDSAPGLKIIEPLGYLDFLKLMAEAKAVLTDSGGMQEETTILGIPCMTVRKNTERPVTIEEGTNRLVDPDEASIVACWDSVQAEGPRPARAPELWDGRAAKRIVDCLLAESA